MKDVIVGLCKAEKKSPEFSLLLKGKETPATSFFHSISLEISVFIYKPFLCPFDVPVMLLRG